MKILVGILSISFFFFLSGCSLFEDPQDQTLIDIKDEFRLELSQTLAEGPNPLKMVISTIEPPGCKHSSIRILKTKEDDNLFIAVLDIIDPQNCETTSESISATAIFDLENKTYSFNLDLNASTSNQLENAISNVGSLGSSDETYTLIMESENGFELGDQSIYKIPDRRMWGTFTLNDENDLAPFQDFLAYMSNHVEEEHQLQLGNYGLFSISGHNYSDINFGEYSTISKKFVFRSIKNPSALKEIIDEYRASNPGTHLFIQHSEGLEL